MVKVIRRDKENINSLLRRFSQKVKESGLLRAAHKKQFYSPPKNKRAQKESALWREKVRALRKRLIKLGELERGRKIDPEKIRKELQN